MSLFRLSRGLAIQLSQSGGAALVPRRMFRPPAVVSGLSNRKEKPKPKTSSVWDLTSDIKVTRALVPSIGFALTMPTSVALAAPAATSVAAKTPLVGGMAASVLSIVPPLFFFAMQSSGLKVAQDIKKDGSVGDRSALPFVSLFTNCVVWCIYGLLQQDFTVMVPNTTGMLLGAYYTSQYHQYSKPGALNIYYAGSSAIVLSTLYMATMLEGGAHWIGLTGCAMAVILMSSPLATIQTVMRNKNTASMPLETTVTTFCNALSWSLYGGLVAMDPMIYGPNLIGLAATCVQLSLFMKYPRN